MTILLMIIFFMFFDSTIFVGIFLYLMGFIYMVTSYNLFGLDLIKGDLYGILGADYISFYMILLLLWVSSLVLILFYTWFLYFLILILLISLLVVFSSMDFLYLFIYFEFSMLPMFLMILFLGGYKERYLAGIYLFIYTMVGSLPMLLALLILQSVSGNSSMDYHMFGLLSVDTWLQLSILMMFLIKVPMFLVHIWLPKAHVEAPVFGSMILASVMLKMGGYGVIRCLDFMELSLSVNDFFFCFCLCGSILISYSCLYQVDLKVLVAYSSIVHMGMVLMGLFSGSEGGYLGGVIMMLSHGICSSGMFYLVNEIYKVTGSRLLVLNKGVFSVMPMLIWMWFIMLVNNLGVPPCFGIVGELLLLMSCLSYTPYLFIFFFLIFFFCSCFVINMYIVLVSGYFVFNRSISVKVITYYGGFFHLIPLNSFIFYMSSCVG